MKRTETHVLEEESKLKFRQSIPIEWIFREKKPDYGIDAEVEIVESGEVTNKVVWVQLKSSERLKAKKKISLPIETKYLKYFLKCNLPVIIAYWIRSEDHFYFMFAQKYINDTLSIENPQWKDQTSVTIHFQENDGMEISDFINEIAVDGYLYVIQRKLNEGIAIVALQKNPGTSYGIGGFQTKAKPSIFCTLEGNILKVEKAKNFNKINPNGYTAKFKIFDGINLSRVGDWIPP